MLDPLNVSGTLATLVEEVCIYLTQHCAERITMDDLAQQFHVSKSHLQTGFQALCGTSVMGYKRKVNMIAAAKLLVQTQRTVCDIAGICGYDNPCKFSAAFRAVMGQTPLRYRKENRVLSDYFSVVSE